MTEIPYTGLTKELLVVSDGKGIMQVYDDDDDDDNITCAIILDEWVLGIAL